MLNQPHRTAALLALLTPAFLLGGAYIGQYVFDLYPCEMCWWQRYPHFAALALGLVAVVRPGRFITLLAALCILASGLIGGYHAGVEYGWWEGFTACTANAAAAGGDPMAAIWNAPLVRCDDVQWSLLGVSLAGYNFFISTAAALLIAVLLRKPEAA